MNETPMPPTTSESTFRIGALLFPAFELLDVFGPLELFGIMEPGPSITMLASAPGAVTSNQGPKAIADAGLEEELTFDLLLVPGGYGTRELVKDENLLRLLRRCAERSRIVASVCTGASLLATAGLLTSRRATTNKRVYDWVTSQGTGIHWVRQARWVQDGKWWTSSGVSAGMDMALAIIEDEFGKAAASQVARRAEYVRNADSTVDPFGDAPARMETST